MAAVQVVAVGGAANSCGTINDIPAVVAMVGHSTLTVAQVRRLSPRAVVYVDAVHYAPHRLIDVQVLQETMESTVSIVEMSTVTKHPWSRRWAATCWPAPLTSSAALTPVSCMEGGSYSRNWWIKYIG